jgi:phosphatidylglycerophosphate synthase
VFPLIYGLHVGWSLGALMALAFVRQSLDCLDGAIARRCDKASKLGALLDVVEDTATVALLGGFVLWSIWNTAPRLRLVVAYIVAHALVVYVRQIRDHVAGRPITYSSFEQVIHDNTVLISIAFIAAFRWSIHGLS